MSLLAVNCRRLIYTKLLRTYAVSSICNRLAAYDSTKFPGFKIVYVLNHVNRISALNRFKYRVSIGTTAILPGLYGLLSMHLLTYDSAVIIAFYTVTTAAFFHAVGMFCNNVIGYIYSKDKTKEIIISYVDFWGKRIDVATKYAEINIQDSNNFLKKSIFNDFIIKSYKKPLKFYTKGTILDYKMFDKMCGITF